MERTFSRPGRIAEGLAEALGVKIQCRYRHPSDASLRCITQDVPVVIRETFVEPGIGEVEIIHRFCAAHAANVAETLGVDPAVLRLDATPEVTE